MRCFEAAHSGTISPRIREWLANGQLLVYSPEDRIALDRCLEVLDWLADSFEAFDLAGGSSSLERCLGLRTAGQRRRAQRDHLVREAAKLVGGETVARQAELLGRELDAFTRCTWQQWRGLDQPPADATPIRRTLFRLMKAIGDRHRLCDRQLGNILRKKTA